ncbi:phospholipase D-like domain-containing protein [Allostella humosa]|uniref:phospholipase D-like domain-containing protein n=1 Tax=Stella humosa TaxID=94 RepID=UPI000F4BBD0A|nr:phosphatidylserine/phosphatidylglycerophosphate/cardiolipin synthase family protein [Stella humosa]
MRPGNRLVPLVDGVPAFRRIGAAVEAARHAVWVTVAFVDPHRALPDRLGSVFDLLDRAAARGLDVRVLFWRPNPESAGYGQVFAGTAADRALLADRRSGWRARWDRAPGGACHHQKSWLVDAGQASEIAFVGGINLTAGLAGVPGHAGPDQQHDAYLELAGPSARDVHHNFADRWNRAASEPDGRWPDGEDPPMALPGAPGPARGDSLAQVQRNLPGAERTILEQYCLAITAAQRTIYIENQALPAAPVAAVLAEALDRGVTVVALVPADTMRTPMPDHLARLFAHPNFTAATLVADAPVHVHAKLMLVDDAWGTIGSCNLHARSLLEHSELNLSFHDPAVVRRLRCDLLAEHLGVDVDALDDRAALALYRRIADANRSGRRQGLAVRLCG